ncbi:hypothetical protein E2C01_025860 [Portunus trituberculatus]|uniref:Uncharacterized protein n=1 Tax=Portunus trituberculatus TaxID=210409 RepID=A0A5B7EGL3_PORTR|nr:hypothetical protein [Portunus trituberculatus]
MATLLIHVEIRIEIVLNFSSSGSRTARQVLQMRPEGGASDHRRRTAAGLPRHTATAPHSTPGHVRLLREGLWYSKCHRAPHPQAGGPPVAVGM